jgi:hypothetical protein
MEAQENGDIQGLMYIIRSGLSFLDVISKIKDFCETLGISQQRAYILVATQGICHIYGLLI